MSARGAALALACALLASGRVRGEPAAAAVGGDGQAQLDLLVNGVSKETVLVLLRGGDALVAPADLLQAGLTGFGGERMRVEGQEWVSLRSLAPEVRFQMDEAALALRLSVEPALLGKSVIDLRRSFRPAGMSLHRDTSGFANYSLQLDSTGALAAFGEAGASYRGALLASGVSRRPDGRVVRGLSSLTVDDPDELRRWVVGDSTANPAALGGGAVLLGVSIAREFSLDPYFIRSPVPRVQGFALTPSTVDVYVNGVLLRQEQVKAGSFELLNLPLDAGDGSVRTVVRDAFGRTQELSGRYYFSSGLLAKGLSDYGYQLGLRRNQFGAESWDYAGLGFLGRHRVGITDRLTAGARLEAARGLVSGGPSLTLGLPFGELELALAASGGIGGLGGAASLGYSYVSRRFSVGWLVTAMSATYANLGLAPQDDRGRLQATVFAGAPVAGRFSVSAELQAGQRRDAGYQDRVALRAEAQVARATVLSLSVGRVMANGSGSLDGYLMLTHSFGDQTTGSAAATQRRSGSGGTVTVQRSLPPGTGLGYRVAGDSSGPVSTGEALLQANGEHGFYQASYRRVGPVNTGTALAAGGIVAMGGNLFFTRPVQEGYALIQVPGVEGVRGFLNNQEVGRTDRRGNLLVPTLSPYYGNRLGIEGTDLPMDYDVGATEQVVATTLRGGARVVFDVKRLQSVTGTVETDRGGPPAFGELRVQLEGGRAGSPVGADGRFWLEGVPAGRHQARVEYGGGTCSTELLVPKSEERTIELGRLRCTAEAAPVASR